MSALTVRSMAVGVFGYLDADERVYALDEDCYSAFRSMSSVMGHLSVSDADEPTRGLWGMNDAGGPWLGGDSAGRRGQFQVTPETDRVTPLPIEPFTATAVAAVERFGPLTLHGLEYYLPISLAGPAATALSEAWGWFAPARPAARTPVQITVDSGESPTIIERRSDLVVALHEVGQGDEGLNAALHHDDLAVVEFADPVPWRWWLGDGAPHTVTFSAVATEWTPLALGRVVSVVSESCRRIGMTEHVGVRVVRDGR